MTDTNSQKCTCCSVSHRLRQGQWWHLSGYHKLWGFFCPDCYEKVSHDAYGNPRHPEEYARILAHQQLNYVR